MKSGLLCRGPLIYYNPDFLADFITFFKYQTIHLLYDREYDQEIPQSQTADNLVAPRGRAAQPSRDTRKTN